MEATVVKERPILMNGEMVRAVLSGQKTQTRRIVTDKHLKRLGLERDGDCIYTTDGPQWDGTFDGEFWCPYGKAGDRLWVRETFGDRALYAAVNKLRADRYYYAADGKKREWKYTPSIHMPRAASRITLEITGVRVERLNDITESDARAEGITDGGCLCCGTPEPCGCDNPSPDATDAFAFLWQSINGPDSWAANPWVWVIEFKKVEA